jgi:transposase, IS6 family
VDHTTIFRWIQAYAVELEKRIRPHLRMSNGSWRVDETYVKVKGRWMYLYRAVDSRGQTIDFLLSAKRDAEAAKRFFRKALAQPHTVNPRTITVDKNAAYPKATMEMKKDGELWRRSRLRQVKYLTDNFDKPFLAIHAFFCSTSATPFFRPDRNPIALPYRAAVKDGRHSAAARRACP